MQKSEQNTLNEFANEDESLKLRQDIDSNQNTLETKDLTKSLENTNLEENIKPKTRSCCFCFFGAKK